MPLSAHFILSDFVIQNSQHARTEENLALLDVASGCFRMIDSVSQGAWPGGIIPEFAGIARRYVSGFEQDAIESAVESFESTPSSAPAAASSDSARKASDRVGTASLNYPSYGNQTVGVQMGELKTLFGWVFSDRSDDI